MNVFQNDASRQRRQRVEKLRKNLHTLLGAVVREMQLHEGAKLFPSSSVLLVCCRRALPAEIC